MAYFDRTCNLVSRTIQRDVFGVAHEIDTERLVYCNVFTISDASFYAASAAGMKPAAKIQLHKADYHGEKLVEFDGELLSVDNANTTSPDYVVLTLGEKVGERGRDNASP